MTKISSSFSVEKNNARKIVIGALFVLSTIISFFLLEFKQTNSTILVFFPMTLVLILVLFFYHKSYWIILSIILMPFVFYLRLFVPSTIIIGGVPFVVTGVIKELLAISAFVLVVSYFTKTFKKNYLSIFLVGYVEIIIINSLMCSSLIESVSYLRVYLISLVYYFAPWFLFQVDKKTFDKLVGALIVFGLLDVLVGYYRYFVDPIFLYFSPEVMPFSTMSAYEGQVFRLNGLMQVNASAVMISISIFLLLLIGRKNKTLKHVWLLLVAIFFLALLLTQSRTGLICTSLAITFWFVCEVFVEKRSLPFIFKTIGLFIGLMVSIFFVQIILQVDVFSRLFDLNLNNGIGRGYYWPRLVNSLSFKEILWGKGLNVFGGMGLVLSNSSIQTTADNFVLQLLVTMGLLGVVPFLGFFVSIIVKAIKIMISNKPIGTLNNLVDYSGHEKKVIIAVALAIILILFVGSVAGVSIQDPFFGALFWFFAGTVSTFHLFENQGFVGKNKQKSN